jgi:CheY-like chemotaxis protein
LVFFPTKKLPQVTDKSLPLVLVVDDDEALRRLLQSALEPRGYRVVGCANGREGLTCVATETPRLIVLDYWMPVLDGAGFMHELPQLLDPDAPRPPVILFTAVSDDARLARSLGVDVYVEKPVDLSRFLKLVDATVRAGTKRLPTERRAARRRVVRRAVEVRVDKDGPFAPAFTVDLSEGGTCLDLGFAVQAGAELAIAFKLPDGARVEVSGRARYTRNGGKVGVEFVALDEAVRGAILSLLKTPTRPPVR